MQLNCSSSQLVDFMLVFMLADCVLDCIVHEASVGVARKLHQGLQRRTVCFFIFDELCFNTSADLLRNLGSQSKCASATRCDEIVVALKKCA